MKTTILCMIAGLTLSGCRKDDPADKIVSVTGVSLNETAKTLTPGGTFVLTAKVAPDEATNKTLVWTSSNAGIASVDKGTVTAVAAGEAVITVSTEDGGKTASCTVTVTVPVDGISLSVSDTTVAVGKTVVLTATVVPDNATNKTLVWTSSNVGIASVQDGTVTAVAAGEAVITVSTEDGKTASCTVTVTVPVNGISLNVSDTTVAVGKTVVLTATVVPDNATNKTLVWTSSNVGIASVQDGTVTAVAAGETVITVSAGDGKTASCTVTVTVPVAGVALNMTDFTLTPGENITLTATVAPDNATNKTVVWTSSNPETVSVKDGTVSAHAVGEAVITVSTEDGGKTASCAITVIYFFDFNNNVFDTEFWTKDLGRNNDSDIRVKEGIMKMEQNSTDVKTHLVSRELTLNNTVTMERDVYLHSTTYANYFYARMYFEFSNGKGFMLGYFNDSYKERYNFGVQTFQQVGENVESGEWEEFPLATILDRWFHEKMEINRTTGKLRYYVDDTFIGERDLSDIISGATSFHLRFDPYGWWTGHRHYFDNFRLSGK